MWWRLRCGWPPLMSARQACAWSCSGRVPRRPGRWVRGWRACMIGHAGLVGAWVDKRSGLAACGQGNCLRSAGSHTIARECSGDFNLHPPLSPPPSPPRSVTSWTSCSSAALPCSHRCRRRAPRALRPGPCWPPRWLRRGRRPRPGESAGSAGFRMVGALQIIGLLLCRSQAQAVSLVVG